MILYRFLNYKEKYQGHTWYAWFPVMAWDDAFDRYCLVWLQDVRRIFDYGDLHWRYYL